MSHIYSIYKAVNLVNRKPYVGFDSYWPNRRDQHLRTMNHEGNNQYHSKFHRALRKYGPETFEWEVIYKHWDWGYCLNVMEPLFIKTFDSFKNGYNSTKGGEGTIGKTTSPETKILISLNHANMCGANNPMYNITSPASGTHWWTNGVVETMSASQPDSSYVLGRLSSPLIGVSKSEKHKESIKQAHWSKRMVWVTDGIDNKLSIEIPEGWRRGRTQPVQSTTNPVSS